VEYTQEADDYRRAAKIGWPLIQKLAQVPTPNRTVININLPTVALDGNAEVVSVPVETAPMAHKFSKGMDPKDRPYYWATCEPEPEPHDVETDAAALLAGKISVSAINSDLNFAVAQALIAEQLPAARP
jgi:5'-nucleotidase